MDDNKERLKRIQEAQIKARDPGSSIIRNYDWAKHAKLGSRHKQRSYVADFFLSMLYRWRGLLMGFCFGAGIGFLLNALLLNEETRLLALVPVLITSIIGYVVGRVMEDPVQL